MTFYKMTHDQMVHDQMTFYQMTHDQITHDQMTFYQMTHDQMTFYQMTCDQMTFYQMTFYQMIGPWQHRAKDIILFTPLNYDCWFGIKARVFVPGRRFQPSLMFWSKAGAYPSLSLYGRLLPLPSNIRLD
jgi:hypothetical protein